MHFATQAACFTVNADEPTLTMQLFGSSTPNDPHAFESPVDRLLKAEKNQPLFGPLEPQDTEWAQHGMLALEDSKLGHAHLFSLKVDL